MASILFTSWASNHLLLLVPLLVLRINVPHLWVRLYILKLHFTYHWFIFRIGIFLYFLYFNIFKIFHDLGLGCSLVVKLLPSMGSIQGTNHTHKKIGDSKSIIKTIKGLCRYCWKNVYMTVMRLCRIYLLL